MKISPLAASVGPNAQLNPMEGRSVSSDKLARAKAVMSGQSPEALSTPSEVLERDRASRRSIRMRTNANPASMSDLSLVTNENKNLETTSEANKALEDTKPISPQLLALEKQKRALQVREKELLAREEALKTQAPVQTGEFDAYRARIKQDPLGVLFDEGFTYEQLIESVANGPSKPNPELNALRNELKALKEGLDTQNKGLSEKEQAAEQTALKQIKADITAVVAADDNFEMIRATNSQQDVVDLIERTYRKHGYIMDQGEALEAVENYLMAESMKLAKVKKLQSQLGVNYQQTQPSQSQGKSNQMRTLTSRDGSSPNLSARERAIMAFHGKL